MTETRASKPAAPPGFPGQEITSARMILVMGSIGILAGVLLAFTYLATSPAIERNQAAALRRAVFEVLPRAAQTVTFGEVDGQLRALDDGERAAMRYYAGYDDTGALVGVAIESAGQGYADTLRIMYGYSLTCECVVGFKVLQSKETPGLGDRIETDPAFTANFQALDLRLDEDRSSIANPVALVKPGTKTRAWQIEGITGATISSRAVAQIIRDSSIRSITLIEHNSEVLHRGSPGAYTAIND